MEDCFQFKKIRFKKNYLATLWDLNFQLHVIKKHIVTIISGIEDIVAIVKLKLKLKVKKK